MQIWLVFFPQKIGIFIKICWFGRKCVKCRCLKGATSVVQLETDDDEGQVLNYTHSPTARQNVGSRCQREKYLNKSLNVTNGNQVHFRVEMSG